MISIILFFSYYNSIHTVEEGFTHHIRRFYRPYVRRTRILTEGFYDSILGQTNRILRKTGLRK